MLASNDLLSSLGSFYKLAGGTKCTARPWLPTGLFLWRLSDGIVSAASLWLLAGLTVIDQRWRWPYDDGSWGTAYFFGQVLANFFLWPGFRVADGLSGQFAPAVRWSIATVVGVTLALLVDWLLRKTVVMKAS